MTNRMMTGMSVFNSNVPEQSNPICNLDWSGFARSSDVEKAATKVAGSVEKASEKMTGKIATDVQRSTDKITAAIKDNTNQTTSAVKDGTKDVVDSVKRIATTNAEQTTPAAEAVHAGLQSVATVAAELAEFARKNPSEIPRLLESAKSISGKFSDLTDKASSYAEEWKRFRQSAAETAKTADWVAGQYGGGNQCGAMEPVNNVFSGGVFNAGGTAPPIVGNFSELLGQ